MISPALVGLTGTSYQEVLTESAAFRK